VAPMSTEYRGREHFLRIHHEEGDRSIEVFHPEGCQREEFYYGWDYNCDIAHHIREWGYDLHLAEVPDGIYLAQYWATPPGWVGPMVIEPNDGIELNPLVLKVDFDELEAELVKAARDHCGCLGGALDGWSQ
jgi:hypothetical protein